MHFLTCASTLTTYTDAAAKILLIFAGDFPLCINSTSKMVNKYYDITWDI